MVACLGGLAGCTTTKDAAVPEVRVRATDDLECPPSQIDVRAEMGGRYRAVGCGRSIVYHTVCEHLRCRIGLEGESAPAWRDRPEPGSIEEGR